MTKALQTDIGSFIATRAGAGVGDLITAGGTGDATEINTEWIDRQGFESCSVFACGKASIADTETLAAAGNLQEATDSSGSGAADYGTAVASTTILTSDGGITDQGFAIKLGDFNLRDANQFIRWQGTPDLSASTTDTADISFIIVLGGADVLPAT